MTWLVALALVLALIAASLRVRRYSPTHIVAEVAIAGRGLYVSRTADGVWWRVRLHRACSAGYSDDLPEDPSGAGSREPRRPHGPGPLSAATRLEPPA